MCTEYKPCYQLKCESCSYKGSCKNEVVNPRIPYFTPPHSEWSDSIYPIPHNYCEGARVTVRM